MTLLGAPVIGSQAMEVTLKEKTRLLENGISRLQKLNSHDGLTILRNNLGISNCAGRPELTEFDEKQRSGLVDILNVELTASQWSQASLRVRSGGLGFRSADTLAASAFLASAASTLEIQDAILAQTFHNPEDPDFAKAISAWQTLIKESPPIQVSQHKQRSWDDAIVKRSTPSCW